MTAALEGGEWSAARPSLTLPPRKTRYPFYRRLGGPQDRSGRAENFVPPPPPEIRSWTAQPVTQSLYRLSYPAHGFYKRVFKLNNLVQQHLSKRRSRHRTQKFVTMFIRVGKTFILLPVFFFFKKCL